MRHAPARPIPGPSLSPGSALFTADTSVHRQRGFTLLEILVVITLIGIMAGAAMLSVGGQQARERKNEAQRLQLLLNQARDESELSQRTLGVKIEARGYQFLEWHMHTQRWHALDTSPYQSQQLAPTTTLLKHDNIVHSSQQSSQRHSQQGPLNYAHQRTLDDGDSRPDIDELKPQIIFSASGDHSAFVLSLSSEEQQYRLSSDGYAATRMQACPIGTNSLSVATSQC